MIFCSFITAMYIADQFVISKSYNIAIHCKMNYRPAYKIYSQELAHSSLLLACKFCDDYGYIYSKEASNDIENGYVYKLEWEIFLNLNCHIRYPKLGHIFINTKFNYLLAYELLKLPQIWNINPLTILLTLKLLGPKLKIYRIYRFMNFCQICKIIERDYELDISLIRREFINLENLIN